MKKKKRVREGMVNIIFVHFTFYLSFKCSTEFGSSSIKLKRYLELVSRLFPTHDRTLLPVPSLFPTPLNSHNPLLNLTIPHQSLPYINHTLRYVLLLLLFFSSPSPPSSSSPPLHQQDGKQKVTAADLPPKRKGISHALLHLLHLRQTAYPSA